MKYQTPSKGFSSILSGHTKQNKVSFDSILHDVRKATADLPESKRLRIIGTIKKMQADPHTVGTQAAHEALEALAQTSHLGTTHAKNIPSAIAHMKAAAPAEPTKGSDRIEAAKKKQEMWALARERRAEAEHESKGGQRKVESAYGHHDAPGSKRWATRPGVGGKPDETDNHADQHGSHDEPKLPTAPVIDMMID